MHKLETYRNVDIYLSDKGKFEAEIGDKKYSRASLSSLKRFLDDNTGDFDAILLSTGWRGISEPRRITVVGPDRRHKYNHAMKASDGNTYGWRSDELIVPYDQDIYDWAMDLHEQQQALMKAFRERLEELEFLRVTARNLE